LVVLGWWGEVMWSGKNGGKLGNRRFSGVAGNTVHSTVSNIKKRTKKRSNTDKTGHEIGKSVKKRK
nr:hypothetical protein [Tanacetum cinerariifolium]